MVESKLAAHNDGVQLPSILVVKGGKVEYQSMGSTLKLIVAGVV
jgi:hypothetical protein